ncbi:MAG: metallophosphoesterase [candidate division Zixibacteria bacterium]|nr:metallophosphoesterase [candidate division Zixibacteria bacterium]
MDRIAFFKVTILLLVPIAAGAAYWLWKILRAHKGIATALSALLLILIFYQVYDNNRVVVKQETVFVQDLPPEFEGFEILQISDLHGKSFGRDQAGLTSKINAIDYDMIAFTGDMETESQTFGPFVALLDGIENKENMFYINGNTDLAYKYLSGIKTEAGKFLEDHGCILLNAPYPIMRSGKTLWLADDLSTAYVNINVYQGVPRNYFRSDEQYRAYQQHFAELIALADRIRNNEDIKIALSHIPHTQSELEQKDLPVNIWDSDLILAGHNHGGQIRIPFYGALFIPARSSFYDGFLPDQKYVSGLVAGNDVQQYVSRGLGASNLRFRLFNTPEINLLILRAK